MTITAIRDSNDLAAVLNAAPLTTEDAAETPRDWLAGIWVAGTVYTLDPGATTETLAVLADGTAAATLVPAGTFCGHWRHTAAAHWCPASQDWVTFGDDTRGVDRDWRTVYAWDTNGWDERTVHPTLDEAKAAFKRESESMATMDYRDWDEDETGDDDELL